MAFNVGTFLGDIIRNTPGAFRDTLGMSESNPRMQRANSIAANVAGLNPMVMNNYGNMTNPYVQAYLGQRGMSATPSNIASLTPQERAMIQTQFANTTGMLSPQGNSVANLISSLFR